MASILRVLLFAVITGCKCEPPNGHHQIIAKSASQVGELLKPPPPPPSNKVSVPFHGGSSRIQRQNVDVGYIYQPPPPPPPPPVPPSSNLKFAVPFYKQYNFNFVPPPQPFTTTQSPSLIQKVSGWLFPSRQTSYEPPVYSSMNLSPVKKDCNPCNLVPWIPVIRYDLAAKNIKQNLIPTYGPPSPNLKQNLIPTYGPPSPNFKNAAPYPFYQPQNNLPQLSPGVPHAVYGQPVQSNIKTPSSTYGPPSPTHIIQTASQNPSSSPYSFDSSSIAIPSTTYGAPSSSISQPSSTFGLPSASYGASSSSYGVPSSTYGTPTSTYATPSPSFESGTPNYELSIINSELPQQTGIESDTEPVSELQLPKYSNPGFKNSYGEPISNTYSLGIPYSVSATAAESTKIEISPEGGTSSTTNMSLALANPAPFTKGRNIHTLQPVALPNLSVSPLPPIFNARPFRPIAPKLNTSIVQGLNYMQQLSHNINIDQSVPIAEFTQSVDYPASVIKSTVIDIDSPKTLNQTKAYRYIPNGFIIDEIRDISSQASDGHVSATKLNQDTSFESTGTAFGNDLYESGLPSDLQHHSNVPSNHNNGFADLRGVKDEDIDKYRTESNLQNIDSPLLYLKPSAPHKDYRKFILAISTPANKNEYEIYDDIPTTISPQLSTLTSSWDESRTEYSKALIPSPKPQEEENKPRIVQIIVPYTTSQQEESYDNFDASSQDWTSNSEEDYQGRKVPYNTEESYIHTVTEGYTTQNTPTDESFSTVTEHYDSDRLKTHAILNDLYDVKEPPFDIIKLQHTIDDWTEQEYSKHYKQPHKGRNSAKYAKQIPDEYFTTISPISNYVTAASNYKYEVYDHEGASSIQHTVTEEKNKNNTKSNKEYNTIERKKPKHSTNSKNELQDDIKKPHIYTAASSFRSTSTTPAPWGKIQTSISPLTKEKIYVVTSKPWLEIREKINEWYNVESFESKKTNADNDVSASDNLPFKSPRFSNRPSFGFTSSGEGKIESLKSDSSYGFSKNWHQSINDLETQAQNRTVFQGGPQQSISTTNYKEETDT